MVSAVLKLTNSKELALVEDNRIVFAVSLLQENYLQECLNTLKPFTIEELVVVYLPTITNSLNKKDYKIRSFQIGNIEKFCYISTEDIEKLQELCDKLDIYSLKIYDTLAFYPLMAKDGPVIIAGENVQNGYSYAYVDNRGIDDYRIAVKSSPKIIQAMLEYHKDKDVRVVSFYSNMLLELLSKKFDNLGMIEPEKQLLLIPMLCTFLIKPPLMLAIARKEEPEELDIPDDLTQEFIDEIDDLESQPANNIPVAKQPDVVELSDDDKPKKGFSFGTLMLDVVGVAASMVLAFSIVANKEMPKDIKYLNDKLSEVKEIVLPEQNTVTYYQKYLKGLQESKNIDGDIVDKISKVKVDGVLGEIKLDRDNVGVRVYLKNAKDIDKVKDDLSKIYNVKNVQDQGVVSVGKTSLNKFSIDGTL